MVFIFSSSNVFAQTKKLNCADPGFVLTLINPNQIYYESLPNVPATLNYIGMSKSGDARYAFEELEIDIPQNLLSGKSTSGNVLINYNTTDGNYPGDYSLVYCSALKF